MEKPSTKKPMNVLKTMVFLKNFMKKEFDFYQPIFEQISFTKPPKIIYYELRIWKNHNIIEQDVFTTLKEALLYYEHNNLSDLEEDNKCFVEIIKIDNLNPRYK